MATSDDKFRDEIIASQKMQADYLKWKLIAVAAIAATSLGFGSSDTQVKAGAQYVMLLIPAVCLYVDLISVHLSLRIVTIGKYLAGVSKDPYELFMFAHRGKGLTPVLFEASAVYGSSMMCGLLLLGFGIAIANDWLPVRPDLWNRAIGNWYMLAGVAGLCFPVLLLIVYKGLDSKIKVS